MKRVVVQMSDECHKALKQYAAFYGVTMSEVLYHNTRVGFHKQAIHCRVVQDIFEKLGIAHDKRQHKPCFGSLCHGCTHKTACTTGFYKGVVELEERLIPITKEELKREIASMQASDKQQLQTALQD